MPAVVGLVAMVISVGSALVSPRAVGGRTGMLFPGSTAVMHRGARTRCFPSAHRRLERLMAEGESETATTEPATAETFAQVFGACAEDTSALMRPRPQALV